MLCADHFFCSVYAVSEAALCAEIRKQYQQEYENDFVPEFAVSKERRA